MLEAFPDLVFLPPEFAQPRRNLAGTIADIDRSVGVRRNSSTQQMLWHVSRENIHLSNAWKLSRRVDLFDFFLRNAGKQDANADFAHGRDRCINEAVLILNED